MSRFRITCWRSSKVRGEDEALGAYKVPVVWS